MPGRLGGFRAARAFSREVPLERWTAWHLTFNERRAFWDCAGVKQIKRCRIGEFYVNQSICRPSHRGSHVGHRRHIAADMCEGPSGGTGGVPFTDQGKATPLAHITQIQVAHGSYIDALAFFLRDPTTETFVPPHGGGGGTWDLVPIFTQPGEVLTGICGRYGAYVDSLILITNKRNIVAKFGGKGGASTFCYTAIPGTEIVGFCGKSGDYIDAIGVVLRPLNPQ